VRERFRGLQERLESTDLGRALISAFILITLVVVIAANLPPSELKAQLTRISNPYIEAVGIKQVWGVFAPDPRRRVLFLEARIRFDDGSTAIWRPPRGAPFPNSYRDVRWRKWVEPVHRIQTLWPLMARWLAREYATAGKRPVEVSLVRRSWWLLPPGPGPDHEEIKEETLYTLDVTDEVLEDEDGDG
jgi:hypothetical protein